MSSVISRAAAFVSEVAFHAVVNSLIGMPILPRPLRWRALRVAGLQVESSCIGPNVYFGSSRVSIQRDVKISERRTSTVPGRWSSVRDGIGSRSMLITGAHEMGGPIDRVGPLTPKPIVIGAGAWVGAGVLGAPGRDGWRRVRHRGWVGGRPGLRAARSIRRRSGGSGSRSRRRARARDGRVSGANRSAVD